MRGQTYRSLSLGLVTTAGAGAMALAALASSAFAYGETPSSSGDSTVGLVMGGSGIPLPDYNVPGYVGAANDLYIDNPLHPNFPGTSYPAPYEHGLFTPEYALFSMPLSINFPNATSGPLTGFPALNTSMGQDMLILENAIATNQAAGDTTTAFGYSQSSTVGGLVMQHLDPTGQPMPDAGLQFVLVGDPSAPNGGMLERFDGLNLPSLGLLFDGATPANDYPTDIYTLEYDGFADFPRYPINILADINALLGFTSIHGLYLNQGLETPGPGPTAQQIADATLLPGSADLGTPDSLTNYYMIDEAPPLVTLLSGLPLIGKPLADLLGPDLTALINLGYGPDNLGYSLAPANVPTPIGLFPDVGPAKLLDQLATGAMQGFTALGDDLAHPSLSALVPSSVDPASGAGVDPSGLADPTHVANGIGGAIAAFNTVTLQTEDIINAAVTAVPAYDIKLFVDNLANPVDAIGLPIAADTGLVTLAVGVNLLLIQQAITVMVDDIAGLF